MYDMPGRSETYIPRGLRKKWKASAYELAVLLLVLTLVVGVRTWTALPGGVSL